MRIDTTDATTTNNHLTDKKHKNRSSRSKMYLHTFFKTTCTLLSLVCMLTTFDLVNSLRDVRVKIPHAVRRGEKAVLKCFYDLEGDSLYSVKWYKGRREFYSFTPKEAPAMKVFQFTGVKVERAASNESQLVLEAVNLATTGKYSCEVSADAPSFHTLISAGELEVVEVPGKDPIITGIRPRYRVGDVVRGNCTARHSKPAANLTWTINDYETNPAHIRAHKPVKDSRDMETAISGIHFLVTMQHFIYGKLKIRCTAHIHDVYWKSIEKSIEEDRHRHNVGNSINLVNNFSDDYFDLEDGNLVDRSDTYTTHIKGDVSSLNSNAATSSHHTRIPLFACCSTLLLLLCTMPGALLQLYQQFFASLRSSKRTITTTISTKNTEGKNSTRTSVAEVKFLKTQTACKRRTERLCQRTKENSVERQRNALNGLLKEEAHRQQQQQEELQQQRQQQQFKKKRQFIKPTTATAATAAVINGKTIAITITGTTTRGTEKTTGAGAAAVVQEGRIEVGGQAAASRIPLALWRAMRTTTT